MLTIAEDYVKSEVKKAVPNISEIVINKYLDHLREDQIVVSGITNIVASFREWYIHNYY